MKSEAAGSPILAEQNPTLYWTIVILIALAVVAIVLSLIIKRIVAWRKSARFIESRKKNFTTKKNINQIYRKASLTEGEARLLWHICKKNKAPNIVFLNMDAEAIEALMKKQHGEMISRGARDEQIAELFSLIIKLERLREENAAISSSESLEEGQELIYKDREGINWTFVITKNTQQGIFLEIPKMFFNSDQKPLLHSKFILTAVGIGNSAYSMQTRAVRYEEALDGKYILVTKSPCTLEPIRRRKYRRMDLNTPCIFTEIEMRAKKGDKTKGYAELGENINGTIHDISAAGCSLSGRKDIMGGRYLLIKFQLWEKDMELTGIIISTTKNLEDGSTDYHVKFTDIQLSVKNHIHAHVYGYTTAKEEK